MAPAAGTGLEALGLRHPHEVLLHLPLRYEDESTLHALGEVVDGQTVQVPLRVLRSEVVFRPRRMWRLEAEDPEGQHMAQIRFFYFSEAQRKTLPVGAEFRALGEARRGPGGVQFVHPKIRLGWVQAEALEDKPLLPVYPTKQGVAQSLIRRRVAHALDTALPGEWLPSSALGGLPSLPQALRLLHQPPRGADLQPAWARLRLDELIAQQIALRLARQRRDQRRAHPLVQPELADRLMAGLPFDLTPAQQRVWAEVRQDLMAARPAHRLIQGDVGSGKTVIAALAVAQALGSGTQAAVMAPTEILARQLADRLSAWLAPLGVNIALLTGRLTGKARQPLLEALADGSLQAVVGTHALIQPEVKFHRLGLALVDEQHRFGVTQRIALREEERGRVPHLLGMSATPIPRTLAMTFLADLDVSSIDERPPGRTPIRTRLMSSSRRPELLERLRHFLDHGDGRAYWVCPLIEEQPDAEREVRALEETEAWLRPALGEQLAVIHGRLSAEAKAQAMEDFAAGRARVLLATTVIEVGVDVPQASLMIVDHAERFGLAQLHQLRGRVGRGTAESQCVLVYDEPLSATARERLRALYESDDGFVLAQKDLEIRGPGEILGLRQSGEAGLRFADLLRDHDLLAQAVDWGRNIAEAASVDGGILSDASLERLGIRAADVQCLLARWTQRAEDLLTSA